MARTRKPTAQELLRLDEIAKHLHVYSRFGNRRFQADVIAASLARVTPIFGKASPCTGEDIARALGKHLRVTFEEVYGPDDIAALEERYLRGKREIGFAQLSDELNDPGVDALLFQRMHARDDDPDHWVAVLNLQESRARAYWNRFHELSHRIAEPPQLTLPLRRHQFEATSPVEALVDAVAAEIAFYAPVFEPLVAKYAKHHRLDFDVVEAIRGAYAPTASVLATIKAVVKIWPRPAAALTAELRGRTGRPMVDRTLRVSPQAYSATASTVDLRFWNNMRPPVGSPVHEVFSTGVDQDASERLDGWSTSTGECLASIDVFTSARLFQDRVYALVST